jgi:hypothetical protein
MSMVSMKMDMEKKDHRSTRKDHSVKDLTGEVIAEEEAATVVVVEVTVVEAEEIVEVVETAVHADRIRTYRIKEFSEL